MYEAIKAPIIEAKKHNKAVGQRALKFRWPLIANVIVADAVPNRPCNLLVPNATSGGTPAISITGIVNRPPPPDIESKNPANRPKKKNNINRFIVRSIILIFILCDVCHVYLLTQLDADAPGNALFFHHHFYQYKDGMKHPFQILFY